MAEGDVPVGAVEDEAEAEAVVSFKLENRGDDRGEAAAVVCEAADVEEARRRALS